VHRGGRCLPSLRPHRCRSGRPIRGHRHRPTGTPCCFSTPPAASRGKSLPRRGPCPNPPHGCSTPSRRRPHPDPAGHLARSHPCPRGGQSFKPTSPRRDHPFGWVVNMSLAATTTTDAVLQAGLTRSDAGSARSVASPAVRRPSSAGHPDHWFGAESLAILTPQRPDDPQPGNASELACGRTPGRAPRRRWRSPRICCPLNLHHRLGYPCPVLVS